MTEQYGKVLERAKNVLTEEYRKALGKKGVAALYDAVMIMAFADGDVDDSETLFLNDFSEYLGSSGTNEDLTPESLLERLSSLAVDPMACEAMLKVLLIVSALDNHIDEDEMAFWRDVGRTLGVTKERMAAIRKLV